MSAPSWRCCATRRSRPRSRASARLIRLLNPELGLINTRDPIGLYVAASGPRARQLTARLGAGWINTTADVAGGVAALEEMRGLWAGVGAQRARRSTRWC